MARSSGFKNASANEAGFALVAILAGLPLLITVLAGLGVVSLALKNRTSMFASCRWSAFDAQKEMSVLLKQLISLNPKARGLRLKRKSAEAEVKAATLTGITPLIVAAHAHRLAVLSAQMQLRAEQEKLLFKASSLRAKAQRDVAKELQSKSGRLLGFTSPSTSLAVRKIPPLDITPDYVPLPSFEKAQVLQFSWESSLLAGAPDWLLRAGGYSKMKFGGECAATINQEKQKWMPHLAAAKFSLK